MAKQAIWLSYDLGVRGDYEALYTWLDRKGAKECGDSVAFFIYEYRHDLKEELTEELGNTLDITGKVRIYLVYMKGPKQTGSFLFGRRKATPWLGYGGGETSDDH